MPKGSICTLLGPITDRILKTKTKKKYIKMSF